MTEQPRTGTGDPHRTLELLWGVHERVRRGPKPVLDLERIVRAAIELADADGLAAVSMRKVAEKLGVGTMSLYRYVPGKGELLDLMFDRAVGDEPLAGAGSGGWREQLEAAGRESFATYRRHPWLLDVVAGNRPPLGPNVMATYDAILGIVHGIGLTPAEAQATVDLFATFVAGAARSALQQAAAEAATGMTDEQWWEQRADFWEAYFDPQRYPAISAVYAEGGYEAPLDPFEFGLARVLDGIEALLAARADGSPDR